MLVHPVRGQPGPDALGPPRRGRHLLAPRAGGVPVVADVVVVEDHRRRHGRHQPADLRVAPRLVVELRVLAEVQHLVDRVLAAAPPAQPLLRLRRRLVGVHLVAEQQQRVRPVVLGLLRHPQRVGVQRVRTQLVVGRGLHRFRRPARPEHDPVRQVLIGLRADPARRELRARLGPHHLAVEPHVVLGGRPRFQVLYAHQRVVQLTDPERPGPVPGDLHLGRGVRLHPHRRGRRVDVSQHRTENQLHHWTDVTVGGWQRG